MAADSGGGPAPAQAPFPSAGATLLPGAARVRGDATHWTAIATGYETREIVVAKGIQFRNEEMLQPGNLGVDYTFPDGLVRKVPGFTKTSDTTGEYLNRKQGVRFILRYVTTKSDLKAALETPKLHVVYGGHARYGRGPCFGPIGSPPGECWEDGDSNTGIFRMGYPFLAVPAEEITEHGYHARPALVDDGVLDKDDCEPDLAAYIGRARPMTTGDLKNDDVAALLINGKGSALDATTSFWGYVRPYEKRPTTFIVLRAGWENTTTAPLDLGATNMQCRVFCHFGCDTLKHNRAILRERKNWQQSGNEAYAYFTSTISYDLSAINWIRYWMTWGQWNAFQSWKPSLDHAKQQTNAWLAQQPPPYNSYQIR
jgi:hypothetical protein